MVGYYACANNLNPLHIITGLRRFAAALLPGLVKREAPVRQEAKSYALARVRNRWCNKIVKGQLNS